MTLPRPWRWGEQGWGWGGAHARGWGWRGDCARGSHCAHGLLEGGRKGSQQGATTVFNSQTYRGAPGSCSGLSPGMGFCRGAPATPCEWEAWDVG